MGWQPSLDGVRAVSVVAVILYHAGFSWMKGGFFGVEVFFVVSGYLITTLLIEERSRSGRVSLQHFWLRRARRLLPALVAMLVVVATWAALGGTAEQQSQIRRDLPWALSYLANWGQIASDTSYFASSPALLRHLWSLAVEEQWYVVWPLAFVALRGRRDSDAGRLLARIAVLVMVGTGMASWWADLNFLYLSTVTRASGLLLGAALAFVWRPWRRSEQPSARALQSLDRAAGVACAVLVAAFIVGRVESTITYVITLPLVTAASAALVAVVVHPWSGWSRWMFSWRPLVLIGQRSYGLYLWSWPISRMVGAYGGSWSKFALAMVLAVPVTEASYRLLEKPIRQGALTAWFSRVRSQHWWAVTGVCVGATVVLGSSLLSFYRQVQPYDVAVGGEEVAAFDVTALDGNRLPAAPEPAAPEAALPEVVTQTTIFDPRLRLVVVGDSQAYSLAVNLPPGTDEVFKVTNGSVEGCGVHSSGRLLTARRGFEFSYDGCARVPDEWAESARSANAQVALVVLGAWDVFDIAQPAGVVAFASTQGDQLFLDQLRRGTDALIAEGAHVALLEAACMRPVSAEGASIPPLPERGDDARIAHLNGLLQQAAATDPTNITFVAGPSQWCNDPAIASDVGYRWDGVHVYKPGAKLIIETIAAKLLELPR
jgi:peptidoglycan/LPS O-acetylase OafA/YrhL